MQRRTDPLPAVLAKPATAELDMDGLPDRLSWPVAGLVIVALALLSWLLILGAAFKLFGLR